MDTIRQFLKTGNLDDLWEKEPVIWIDHRDYDEAIIEYCEAQLNTGKLSVEVLEAQNELGYELKIIYGDKTKIVPFDPQNVSRDTTLITLNQLITPDYEIRLWMDSIGSDTLAFILLSSHDWSTLADEFGQEKILYHFPIMNEQSRMFQLSFDEVMNIAKERGL